MKRLLLMGTALLSIAPYASAMNRNQQNNIRSQTSSRIDSIDSIPASISSDFSSSENTTNSITPPHSINNNNAPLPSGDENSSAFVNDAIKFEKRSDSYNDLLKSFWEFVENHSQEPISSQNWDDWFSRTLEILQNIAPLSTEEENSFDILRHKLMVCFLDQGQDFSLQAAEQTKQLYEAIHNNPMLNKLFLEEKTQESQGYKVIKEIIQWLFMILIDNRNAEIGSDLASKLLKDQDITSYYDDEDTFFENYYLLLKTMSSLIASGKGSLGDIIFSQKGSLTDNKRSANLKSIIDNIIKWQQNQFDRVYYTKQKIKEQIVDEMILIFQTKVIDPLKEFFNKKVDEKIIDPLEKIKLFKKLISFIKMTALKNKKPHDPESIEYLYYEKLEKLINPCLQEPLIQAGKESVSASTLDPSK